MELEVAAIGLLGTLIGGLVTIVGSVVVTYLTNKRASENLRLQHYLELQEAQIIAMKNIYEDYIKKIELYTNIRLAMMQSLARPLVKHPEPLFEQLLPELWNIGGQSMQAQACARILGSEELVTAIRQMEDLFEESWQKLSKDSTATVHPEIEADALKIASNITQLVTDIKVRIVATGGSIASK